MRRFLRPSRLLPLALVLAAAGLAFSGANTSAVAAETQRETVQQGKNTSARPGERIVGSGRENYTPFVEGEGRVPAGPNEGEQLYIQGCSSCHGLKLEGSEGVPPLVGVGAAAVDFYVSTGRMPADDIYAQAPRKDPVYDRRETLLLADYVAQFGDGPPIPNIDYKNGDIVEGNALYANNCAACHNSNGSGGALTSGFMAPPLGDATMLQVAEAIRVGPGAMPVYGPETFSDEQVASILAYVHELEESPNPGGLPLGHLGPVPEGFFAWIVGLGLLLGVARWIGTRV